MGLSVDPLPADVVQHLPLGPGRGAENKTQ